MAGPQIRGDIRVSRNVETKKVRQGTRTFIPTSGLPTITLTSGDTYSVILNAASPVVEPQVRLPALVVSSSSAVTNAVDSSVTHIPLGPGAGVGTEFRISNFSGTIAKIENAQGVPLPALNIPNGRTAIILCTSTDTVDSVVGTWVVYIIDESSATLAPNNIIFDANVGTIATGVINIDGTAATADITLVVTFTNSAGTGNTFLFKTLDISTDDTAGEIASALADIMTGNTAFSEFYTAIVNSEDTSEVLLKAIDNGTAYNSTAFTTTLSSVTAGITIGTPTPGLASGTNGSWTFFPVPTLPATDADAPYYFFRIAGIRHKRGKDPIIETFEHASGVADRTRVLVESKVNVSSGAIEIRVNVDTPDTPILNTNRFAGSVDVL